MKILYIENKLHLKKVNIFYVTKHEARVNIQKLVEHESIAMDFQTNLPLPRISRYDIRMLNIYVCSTGKLCFYSYDETVACKGADEVASFLFHFLMVKLDPRLRGKNKN